MRFQIARAAAHTGRLLQELVEEELRAANVRTPDDAMVCYGVGSTQRTHVLNAACSRWNKHEQGTRLQAALRGSSLEILTAAQAQTAMRGGGMLLARKAQHTQGRDIMPVLEPWQIPARVAAGAHFFTPYVPSVTEYRTWVYRNRILGTYEKRLERPAECTKLGRNHANGFDFSFRENDTVPDALKVVARGAVAALDLDFGMVDLLETPDHRYVVIEVNSAGGVQNERRRVIQALAHRVMRWAVNGCPDRRADGAQ